MNNAEAFANILSALSDQGYTVEYVSPDKVLMTAPTISGVQLEFLFADGKIIRVEWQGEEHAELF